MIVGAKDKLIITVWPPSPKGEGTRVRQESPSFIHLNNEVSFYIIVVSAFCAPCIIAKNIARSNTAATKVA